MSSAPRVAGIAGAPTGGREQDPPPDVELELPADRRAAFRARGEIHRLLHDVHPQRRAVAARVVGALLDAAFATPGQPIELRLWRSPNLLEVQLRSTARLRVPGESRLVLEHLAERWELDRAGHAIRFEFRTDMSTRTTA